MCGYQIPTSILKDDTRTTLDSTPKLENAKTHATNDARHMHYLGAKKAKNKFQQEKKLKPRDFLASVGAVSAARFSSSTKALQHKFQFL